MHFFGRLQLIVIKLCRLLKHRKNSVYPKVRLESIKITQSIMPDQDNRVLYLTTKSKYLVALLKELESIGVRLTKEILSKITGNFFKMSKKDSKNISKSNFSCQHKVSI